MTQLQVSGGAGGVDARLEDLRTLGRCSDDLARSFASISADCHAVLVDADLLASAVLDPAGAARVETALLGALDGRGGLTALGARFGAQAIGLRAAAATYAAVDAAQAELIDTIRWNLGAEFGAALPLLLPSLAEVGGLAYLLGDDIDYQRLLTDHPGLVDDIIGGGPGLLSVLTGTDTTDVTGASHLLAGFYPDGRAELAEVGVDPTSNTAPSGFGDLVARLDHRNDDAGNVDQIDVQVITHADGTRAYIVDIPGTKVWDLPGSVAATNDLGTNLHILGGDQTAREAAIAEALRRAGASERDPVMLVGHSQGGMLAAQAAHDSRSAAFPYNVTHVVTAGSPIAHSGIPGHVQVLALENKHDIVPHLDARDNGDRPNITTVRFDSQLGSIGENHSTGHAYAPAAKHLDGNQDPSIEAYRRSADAFLASGAVSQTTVYEISRGA